MFPKKGNDIHEINVSQSSLNDEGNLHENNKRKMTKSESLSSGKQIRFKKLKATFSKNKIREIFRKN
jgi:hypothetical protein